MYAYINICLCEGIWRGRRHWNASSDDDFRTGHLTTYLVMILQHLSYDPDFRVVVLYGDHSKKERSRTEAGSV